MTKLTETERRQIGQRLAVLRDNNTSGFRGVSLSTNTELRYPWMAQLQDGDVRHWCGYHASAREAAIEYDKKAHAVWGIRPNRNLGLLP